MQKWSFYPFETLAKNVKMPQKHQEMPTFRGQATEENSGVSHFG